MPMRKDVYPPDWESISLAVKVGADWICGDCGRQCRRPGEPFDTHRRTMSVHHLGVPRDDGSAGDMHDKFDVRPCNLIGLCSDCHLERDRPGHVLNAARTRRAKKVASGQMEIEL